MNKRAITVDEVREHDARSRCGWGRWRRTDEDGSETNVLLRASGGEVENFTLSFNEIQPFVSSSTPVCSSDFLTAQWTPLHYVTNEPIAGHEDRWTEVIVPSDSPYRVRWNGARVVVSKMSACTNRCTNGDSAYDPVGLARAIKLGASRLAAAAGAIETFRVEVLTTLINDAMPDRGAGEVRLLGCGITGLWVATVNSVDSDESVARTLGKTRVEAIERLAVLLGVSR